MVPNVRAGTSIIPLAHHECYEWLTNSRVHRVYIDVCFKAVFVYLLAESLCSCQSGHQHHLDDKDGSVEREPSEDGVAGV